jgi:hypothetical protein
MEDGVEEERQRSGCGGGGVACGIERRRWRSGGGIATVEEEERWRMGKRRRSGGRW